MVNRSIYLYLLTMFVLWVKVQRFAAADTKMVLLHKGLNGTWKLGDCTTATRTDIGLHGTR